MASKRRLRRKACGGKVKHATQTAAVGAAISHYRRHGERLSSYRCHFCSAWHVGHPKHKKRR